MAQVLINNLLMRCIVGCNTWEREEAQSIIVNLVLWSDIRSARRWRHDGQGRAVG